MQLVCVLVVRTCIDTDENFHMEMIHLHTHHKLICQSVVTHAAQARNKRLPAAAISGAVHQLVPRGKRHSINGNSVPIKPRTCSFTLSPSRTPDRPRSVLTSSSLLGSPCSLLSSCASLCSFFFLHLTPFHGEPPHL